jgi:hypothetical protein
MDNKYRILYNDSAVVDVLEDYGTTFIGAGTNLMVLVDTKENAKIMLEAIGINTARLFGEGLVDVHQDLTGIDYLNNINDAIDPHGLIDGGLI